MTFMGEATRAKLLETIQAGSAVQVAYIPANVELDLTLSASGELGGAADVVTPILSVVPESTPPKATLRLAASGWIAPREAAVALLGSVAEPSGWGLAGLIAMVERGVCHWRWNSVACRARQAEPNDWTGEPLLTERSRVLAVVAHFGCERWLAQCLYSLTSQTRPPDHIVVVDDASAVAPRDIVGSFPEVTLLASPVNIGPENILQTVIQTMDYDAFMVQDADDWCSANRLERLLVTAERTGAALAGAQEIRFPRDAMELTLRLHPLDVNHAISEQVGHYLCHGTSLISRAAAKRVGGFDTSLQLTADTDFTLRVSRAGRVVNLPEAHYYRRMRPDSRTSAAATGQGSPARDRERDFIYHRAQDPLQAVRVTANEASGIEFRHVLGPPLARGLW